MHQNFSISRGAAEGCQVVLVRGDLDQLTAPLLDVAIDECRAAWPLVVDLSGVEFISSAGLHTLLRERPFPVSIVAPPGNITRVFDVVRARDRCPLFPDLESAVRAASGVAVVREVLM